MRKFNFLVFSAIIFALGFIACQKSELSGGNLRMKAPEYDEKLAAEYNADFDRVAFAVNQLLREIPDFRNILHKEVGGMFDGDYNVLISQLLKNYNPVVEWFWQCEVGIQGIVEKYPLIQIAIPVYYEKWKGNSPLPVVFIDYGYDEAKTLFVRGYGSKGEFIMLDAVEEPDFPVVVISENERTALLEKFPEKPGKPQNLTATADKEGILLEWEQLSDEDVVGYDIYRKGESDKEFVQIASLISSKSDKNTYSFVDGNVVGGGYQYYVVATGNHLTREFIITRDDLYTLKKYDGILYSAESDVITGDGPMPLGTIKLIIYYDVSKFLRLQWNTPVVMGATYNVYRIKNYYINNGREFIGNTTSNFFIDDDNLLDQHNSYQYQVTTSGNPYIVSNYVFSHISHRSKSQKVQIKECKFNTMADLSKVEHWTRGAPEMNVRCLIGNQYNVFVLNKHIPFKPSSRKTIVDSWWPVNKDFLKANEVNTFGSMVSFFWWEEDGGCGGNSYPINAGIWYEDHYKWVNNNNSPWEPLTNQFQTSLEKVTDIHINDDLITIPSLNVNNGYIFQPFHWWDFAYMESDIPMEIHSNVTNFKFQWKIKTIN